MTEVEWNACTDLVPMLEFLQGKISDRKFRLLAVACCRRIWRLLDDRIYCRAVERAEEYADGLISKGAIINASLDCESLREQRPMASAASGWAAIAAEWTSHLPNPSCPGYGDPWEWGRMVSHFASMAAVAGRGDVREDDAWTSGASERTQHVGLLHEITGNPFRPVALDPLWLTPTVKQLAAAIYEERAFDRMPILGDAMEEAGSTDAEILSHCRQPGEHVRGCWVVDLVLGES